MTIHTYFVAITYYVPVTDNQLQEPGNETEIKEIALLEFKKRIEQGAIPLQIFTDYIPEVC